jgi:5S rRNA maturation endonuclease (ribonuclease M5)
VNIFQITLDTCFKQFIEAKGIRLADVKHGTALYRKLVKEFNDLKQVFIDMEEKEEQLKARALEIDEESG